MRPTQQSVRVQRSTFVTAVAVLPYLARYMGPVSRLPDPGIADSKFVVLVVAQSTRSELDLAAFDTQSSYSTSSQVQMECLVKTPRGSADRRQLGRRGPEMRELTWPADTGARVLLTLTWSNE